MSQPTAPEQPDPSLEQPGTPQGFPFLVLQFFLFPLAIVAVSVTVFVIFGLVASEGKGARDYLSQIRSGGSNSRWQAAFELSRVIQAGDDPALEDPEFVSDMTRLFVDSANDDPRVRRYLALALGRLGDRRAVPVLLDSLEQEPAAGDDSQTRIFTVWALGAIGDPACVPALVALAGDPDPGLRKTAVHSLGAFTSSDAVEAVAERLDDAVADVRWNAAVALARSSDPRCVPVLLEMLDAGRMARVDGLSPEQREQATLQAVAAAARIDDPRLRDALVQARDSDASLKVREAARSALERAD